MEEEKGSERRENARADLKAARASFTLHFMALNVINIKLDTGIFLQADLVNVFRPGNFYSETFEPFAVFVLLFSRLLSPAGLFRLGIVNFLKMHDNCE